MVRKSEQIDCFISVALLNRMTQIWALLPPDASDTLKYGQVASGTITAISGMTLDPPMMTARKLRPTHKKQGWTLNTQYLVLAK
jgi:hypothetical protein